LLTFAIKISKHLECYAISFKYKALLQKLRNKDCNNLLEKVVSFSKQFEIDIPNLGAYYVEG
jgi:hypothetical protein